MTMNEQHEEIGRMYAERENVERQSACIENKLARLRQKLIDAASAIEKRHEDGAQTAIDAGPAYQSADHEPAEVRGRIHQPLGEAQRIFRSS